MVFDILVAVALVALGLSLLIPLADRNEIDSTPLAIVLVVVHAGCLAWRRRAPVTVFAVNLASAVAFITLGYPVTGLGVAVLVALYTVASLCDRRTSLVALAIAWLGMTTVWAISSWSGDLSTLAGNLVVLGVVWFLGDSLRARRTYVVALEQRTTELERAREELANRAVADERLRIARELHDITAHSLGMIVVQAGVGAHVIDERPDEARRSLETIEKASRSSLNEIRRILGLLRENGGASDTSPAPGTADIAALAEDVRAAGVEVDLQVDDPSEQLPPAIQLAIFRIVQEALTNVVKHASARMVRVSVRRVEDEARVEIVDDGTPMRSKNGSPGHGLIGMRERAAMHGGTVEAGPLSERGFRVSATFPLENVT